MKTYLSICLFTLLPAGVYAQLLPDSCMENKEIVLDEVYIYSNKENTAAKPRFMRDVEGTMILQGKEYGFSLGKYVVEQGSKQYPTDVSECIGYRDSRRERRRLTVEYRLPRIESESFG